MRLIEATLMAAMLAAFCYVLTILPRMAIYADGPYDE